MPRAEEGHRQVDEGQEQGRRQVETDEVAGFLSEDRDAHEPAGQQVCRVEEHVVRDSHDEGRHHDRQGRDEVPLREPFRFRRLFQVLHEPLLLSGNTADILPRFG